MKPLAVLLLITLFPMMLFALHPDRAITQYVRNFWDSEMGLPQNSVFGIHQTRDGYLWIATLNGLGRFDGARFEVFDSVRVPELTAPEFFCFLEEEDGTLWIGSYWGGLIEYKNGRFRKYGKPEGLSDERVVSMEKDRDGNLWLGTPDGLFQMSNGKFKRYWKEDGLPGRVVWKMAKDHSGKLWLATVGGGLYSRHNGKFLSHPAITAKDILCVLVDRNNHLWVGSDEGLILVKNDKITTFTTKDGLASDVILSLLQDRDGNIWIGQTTGLSRFHNGTIRTMAKDQGLNHQIKSLYEDREGTLWVGTFGGGLFSFRDGKVIAFSKEEGLAADQVSWIQSNAQGVLWIGTKSGISRIEKDPQGYSIRSFSTTDAIHTVIEDSQGNVWAGLEDHGLMVLRNNKLEPFSENNKLVSKQVWTLFEETPGTLWIASFGKGINRLKDGKFDRIFTVQTGLPTPYVSSFASNPAVGLLIATEDAGVLRFQDEKFSTYISQETLQNQVTSLYFDAEGILWMTSLGGGLKRFKDGKIKSIRRTDGLVDDTPLNILQDENGNFWVDSVKGIFSISKKQLNDLADGKISKIQCMLLGKSDGMKSAESTGVAWKTADGKLWFPTAKGAVLVDPKHTTKNTIPPPVHIEKLLVDGQPANPMSNGQFTLKPGSEKIEFHYTALSLADPSKVKFKYKLEGFDAKWVHADTRRVAYYTHIPHGNYSFRVSACNNDQVWNEAGALMGFKVEPHFYQTIWFHLLWVSGVVGLALALHRFKMKKAGREFAAVLAERARIAREIHDGLTQAMAGVVMQLETARLVPEKTRSQKHMDRALELARRSVEDARRTIGDLRPRPLSSVDFPEGLRSLVENQLEDSTLDFSLQVTGNPSSLSSQIQTEVLQICREAVQNAIKHSNASKIIVELHYEDAKFRMIVQDNGRGFDSASPAPPAHYGMEGMKERSAQINSRIHIDSNPAHGTRVELIVPL